MIEKISKYQNSNTILEHFEFYDIRQENYEKNMQMKKNNYNQQSIPQAQINNENKETDKNNTNNNQ